eukprot:9289051-Heterocapsa_arctica.AAC.1
MGRRRDGRGQRTDVRIHSRRSELTVWRTSPRWSSSRRTERRSGRPWTTAIPVAIDIERSPTALEHRAVDPGNLAQRWSGDMEAGRSRRCQHMGQE